MSSIFKNLASLFAFCGALFVGAMQSLTVYGAEIELAAKGESAYKIVLPNKPSPVQQSAANELRTYFKQVTDVELPIISEADIDLQAETNSIANAQLFIIGPSELSQKLLGKTDEKTIGYDGIILKSIGNAVVMSGDANRGPIYSVYEFLEKKLGCRWWTSRESTIPHTTTLKIDSDLDICYVPKLEYRESFYRDAFDGSFAVKMKCNGNSERIAPEFGSHHSFMHFVHSSFELIPPQKYFLDHPDWFSEIDGVRKVGYPRWAGSPKAFEDMRAKLTPEQIHESGTQLCFSNDEMLAELIENARQELRAHPNASFLSVSQNDWHGFCTCEKCRAIDEEEGSHAASLLRGVNKVAEALEEEFPNLYVETLAYQYTRKPPKITKPRKNVVVRLCSIECSFAQPLSDEANKTFRDDLVGWSNIADKLFVWDYATDFAYYLLPFPNYRVLAPNINFYIDHNVVGFFEQGDYQTETGDFVQLRNWVVSKLLWDPSLDPKALVEEFIAGYYAPELVEVYRKYFDVLSDAVERDNYYLSIYKTNTEGWLDIDSLNQVTLLQREALEIAKNLELHNPEKYKGLVAKVRREQIPLDVVWMQEYSRIRLESRLTGKEFVGPKDPLKAAHELHAKLDEFGLTRRRESETPESYKLYKDELLARYVGYQDDLAYVPEVCKNIADNSWINIQEGGLNKSKLGEWTFTVSDPKASNALAIKMPGTHFEWATSWNVSRIIGLLAPCHADVKSNADAVYHVYAYLRCNASVDSGDAMTAGVYDEENKKSMTYVHIPVSEIKGDEYKLVDLGTTTLTDRMYVWFAPPKRPDEVDSVYIDNLIIIREN